MIHFDFDDRYQDEPLVGTAISRREATAVSVVFHGLVFLALLFVPGLPMFQRTPEELEALRQQQLRTKPPEENRTFVFVQPRVDLEAPKPPPRAEPSDKDREASARERAENPTNSLPFARGNTSDRVEATNAERARGPESPAPPSPGDAAQSQPPGQQAQQQLPVDQGGLTVPRETQQQARAGSGALGEALRNLDRYVQNRSFDNQGGDSRQFGPFLQFDTKGVEFGPWVRRFVAQVKRNWYIPDSAMFTRGHVIITFNVHRDGRITDVSLVGSTGTEALNNSSLNAILASNPTEPLPPEYPSPTAFFTVTFFYNEEPPAR